MRTGRDTCFAAVPYANAEPLVHFLPGVCPGARVIRDVPSRLLRFVQDGSADAAILPVAELVEHPELKEIGGVGICAQTRSRSVLLKCRCPLEQVRVVELDPASRTSNALAGVLFEKHWKLKVRTVWPGGPDAADAAIVIGDRALCSQPSPHGDYDLAEQWHLMTGLPFVFAVWACRGDHPDPEGLSRVLHAACEAGLAAVPELARLQAVRLGASEASCLDYLCACMHYRVGAPERQAMDLFRQLIAGADARPIGRGEPR